MKIIDDLSGRRFTNLTVIKPILRPNGFRTKYECKCICGKHVIVEGSKLRNGHTRSCGCIRKLVDYGFNRKPVGEAARNALIYNYRRNAKSKNKECLLTDEHMIKLFQSKCNYCGSKPKDIFLKKRLNGGYIYNGIDRLDSSKGYTLDNVVPCCSQCNYIKNNIGYGQFVAWIGKVYSNLHRRIVIKVNQDIMSSSSNQPFS